MKKLEVYQLLDSLSVREWNQLERFIKIGNPKKGYTLDLFNYVREHRRPFPSSHQLKKNLFPDLEEKAILNKCSQLKRWVESYMVWKNITENDVQRKILLHESLMQRSLFRQAQILRNKLLTSLLSKEKFRVENLYNVHHLLHTSFFSSSKEKLSRGDILLENSEQLLKAYVDLIKAQYSIEQASRREIRHKDDEEPEPLMVSLSYVEENVDILLSLEEMVVNKSQTAYRNVKAYLLDVKTFKRSEFFVFILATSIQHLLREMRKFYDEDESDIIDFFEVGLLNGSFLHRGFITSRVFETIIDAACALNKLTWAQEILSNYLSKVEPKVRYTVDLLNRSQILMAQKKFVEAMVQLDQVETRSLDHKLRYRWLKMACLYETRDEYFGEFNNAFKKYLKSNEAFLSPAVYQGVTNFREITMKLWNKRPMHLIVKAYKEADNLIFRSWLRKKIKS